MAWVLEAAIWLHGLRVIHAPIIAETGGKESATTGTDERAMERRYSQDAHQRRMARENIVRAQPDVNKSGKVKP